MPDIPGNSSTTTSITVGGSVDSALESLGDHDWIRIDLVAGQSITVFVDGITLEDPYVYIRNSAGALLFENDDINPGVIRDSKVSFTVPSTGTYYIDVGSFDESYTGDYQVSVSVYTPPPLASYDEIAQQLVVGYWGSGQEHHFDVTQGGTITVNITGLTTAGKTLARAALAEWTDVIGVTFTEVTSGGQIVFDDNQSGAATDGTWSNGIATSAHVNVSTAWLAQYGAGLNSYSFQTYIHEIGHALGLGHAGYYNGTASYPTDALFQNDAWATSIMSYFSQTENTYFAGQGFTQDFIVTPMLADIIAMSTMYGLSTTTRTGDTTYGFNSNAGSNIYNATLNPDVAYTVFDSGGTDTLDYSEFATNQLINLNPETFSNVGPGVGNVAIARGVIIENALGGSGNDTLLGNSVANILTGNAGNDLIDGRAGADTMIGGDGNDRYLIDQAGDVITELAGQGDDMVIARASYILGAAVSVETLTTVSASATTAINLTGNEFSQSLYGNNGDNVLYGMGGADYLVGLDGNDGLLGGTGADTLAGGLGNDVYYVDNLGDQVLENAGEGEDLVVATASYALNPGAAVETISAQPGSAAINLTGNEFGQSLYGNSGDNVLIGLGGSDYLVGGAGNDRYYVDATDNIAEAVGEGDDSVFVTSSYALRDGDEVETLVAVNQDSLAPLNLTGNEYGQSLYGSQGANALSGGAGSDYLVGLGGNDFLLGGLGNDNLAGGAGNDIYYVDAGDQIFESASEGDDLVVAFESFALGGGQSVETLAAADGAGAISLAGNALAQSLYGNSADNILSGGGGGDYLIGREGNDVFVISSLALGAAGNVATVGDYATGDVVDLSQLLNLANGADLVAGGYARIVGDQLQVDANGGADNWVTVASVGGSGPVVIRYLSGGNSTDISVARSAGMTAMAVAAAGLAVKLPGDAPVGHELSTGSDADTLAGGPLLHTQALAPIALDGVHLLQASIAAPLADGVAADHGAAAAVFHAPAPSFGVPLLDFRQPTAPAALLAATDAPVHGAMVGATSFAAATIAMPSADMLAALAGDTAGAQHNQVVGQVLADALAGGAAHAGLDQLLASPAGHGAVAALVAIEALATPAEGGFHFAAAPVVDAFALDAFTAHLDAPAAA